RIVCLSLGFLLPRAPKKLSSRAEGPDFLFRADMWRVGPRSRGICFSLSLCPLCSSLCDLCVTIPLSFPCAPCCSPASVPCLYVLAPCVKINKHRRGTHGHHPRQKRHSHQTRRFRQAPAGRRHHLHSAR